MLCGILYGSQYGGSTTSILVNIPGEAASIVTCLDGYQMARKGRAGPALGIAAWGSFIAGTISVIALMIVANPLAKLALKFGPPEYFALMCTGLIFVTYLAQGSVLKAIMMALTGIILGSIGLDLVTGQPKFTLGIPQLEDGMGVMPVIMGLFGLSEVFQNIESKQVSRIIYETKVKNLWPSLKDWIDAKWAILRGTLIGFFLVYCPGGGGTLASFLSYGIEKRVSKHPEKFGTGVIEGVAAPESANNASCGGGLIPLLSLGIPPNVTMAVLFSAFIIHGITPGPLLITEHPDVFWGLIASMYLGNILLLLHESSADRAMGPITQSSIRHTFSLDPSVLRARIRFCRCFNDRHYFYAFLRCRRLPDEEIQISGSGSYSWLCSGADDRTLASSVTAYLRRKLRHFLSRGQFLAVTLGIALAPASVECNLVLTRKSRNAYNEFKE